MNKLVFLIFIVIACLSFIPRVYAESDSFNLLELPERFANAFNISVEAGRFLTCLIFSVMVMFPLAYATRNLWVFLIAGFSLLGFFIAVGWLSSWFILIVALFVGLLLAGKISGLGEGE